MTERLTDEALLPCPFCGGEASSKGHIRYTKVPKGCTWDDGEPITEGFFCNCVRCGVSNQGALHGHRTREKAITAWNRRATPADDPFQARVDPWMQACFGAEVSADRLERGDRLLEEVLELLQSGDYPAERVAMLTNYVWSRDIGEPAQEVGGVMVTLAAYCLAHGLDMHEAGDAELARIWTKVEKIRAKQAAKPKGSALPQAWPAPAPQPADDLRAAVREAYEAGWAMDEAFGVREDSCQMAASERLTNALTALRDIWPEVDQEPALSQNGGAA